MVLHFTCVLDMLGAVQKHSAKKPSSIVTITFVSCRRLKAISRYKIVMYAAEVLLLGRSSNDEAM